MSPFQVFEVLFAAVVTIALLMWLFSKAPR